MAADSWYLERETGHDGRELSACLFAYLVHRGKSLHNLRKLICFLVSGLTNQGICNYTVAFLVIWCALGSWSAVSLFLWICGRSLKCCVTEKSRLKCWFIYPLSIITQQFGAHPGHFRSDCSLGCNPDKCSLSKNLMTNRKINVKHTFLFITSKISFTVLTEGLLLCLSSTGHVFLPAYTFS